MKNKRKPVIDEENNSPTKRSKITGKPGHSYDHFKKVKAKSTKLKYFCFLKNEKKMYQ